MKPRPLLDLLEMTNRYDSAQAEYERARSAFNSGVGQTFADARRSLKLTQAQAAASLNVTRSYIARLESGRTEMTTTQAQKMADALDAYTTGGIGDADEAEGTAGQGKRKQAARS